VLISLDGLRPDFYLDSAYEAPTLRTLARSGAHARGAEGVFPTVTYPNHASIVTGVRPAGHGVFFNVVFEPSGGRSRWYEEASDLRALPLWEWARAAGLRTAGVAWPSTLGARVDFLLPERDYYARPEPLALLERAVTPGLFERLQLTPSAAMFKDVVQWDAFLAATAVAVIRAARPHLLLLHLVQLDYFQHRGGVAGPEVKPALGRVDAHVAAVLQALRDAGIADRSTVIVVGDHGFQDSIDLVYPNAVLTAAGLRGCPGLNGRWRATAHVSGGAAGIFVNPPGDAEAAAQAEAALRGRAGADYTVLTRAELDALGAMTGAAFAIEASPGRALRGDCGRRAQRGPGGTHGYLPTRPSMLTGFVAAGAGVRPATALERIRLIDVAPTAARLLGLTPPSVEGRVLVEILP
jgi:predicted AlkP superfamily pyrophosphatase or phosphodiesterase